MIIQPVKLKAFHFLQKLPNGVKNTNLSVDLEVFKKNIWKNGMQKFSKEHTCSPELPYLEEITKEYNNNYTP